MSNSVPTREDLLQRLKNLETQLSEKDEEISSLKSQLQIIHQDELSGNSLSNNSNKTMFTPTALKERFEEAELLANIGHWEYTIQEDSTYWSKGIYDLFRIEQSDIIPNLDTFLQMIHPDDRNATYKTYTNALKNKTSYECEYKIILKDGSIKHIFDCGITEYDENDRPIRTFGVIQDITKRKNAEIQLQEIAKRLNEAEKIAKIGHWIQDVTEESTEWSDGIYQIFQLDKKQFVPNVDAILNLVHPEDRDEFFDTYNNKTLKSTHPVEFTHRVLLPNGRIKYIYNRGITEFDKDGKPKKSFGTIQDVTEIISTKKALLESEKKFRGIFENALTGIAVSDAEGKLIAVNDALCKMFEYTKEEMLGTNFREYAVSNDLSDEEEMIKQMMEGSIDSYRLERRNRTKSGNIVWIEVSISILRNEEQIPMQFIGVITNTTARKQTETVLKEREEHYRNLVNAGTDALYLIQHDGRIVDTNPAATKMLGYSREEILQLTVADVDPNFPLEAFYEFWENNPLETPTLFETLHKRKDGTVFPVEINGIVFMLAGKKRYYGLARDITDRKKAEKEIKDNLTDLRLAQKIAQVGNWYFDPEIGFPVWSKEIYRIYERNEEEGVPHINDYEKLYNPEEYDKFKKAFNNAVENGEPYDVILIISLPHGKKKWIRAICQPEQRKGPAGHCLRGTIQDITELKLLEEKLRLSEERWRFALEGAGDGVWDWEAKTDLIYLSEQAEKLLGFEKGEISGKIKMEPDAIHPDDLSNLQNALSAHHNGKAPLYISEHRIKTKSGDFKWFLVRGKVIEWYDNKKPKRMLGTLTDLSERIEMENNLRELNETKDKFLSIISHDLRNPFHAIMASSELLKTTVEQKDFETSKKIGKLIHNAANQTYNKLNDLLQWARLQTGKLVFNPQIIDLPKILKSVIAAKNIEAENKRIVITKQISDIDDFYADELMLKTILDNLLSNAIKFSYPGEIVSIAVDDDENNTTFSVYDNGIGISDERVASLFKMDSAKSKSGTQGEQGTGLGLILCKEFVEQHKGTITVSSKKDKGSTFTFTIPKNVRNI